MINVLHSHFISSLMGNAYAEIALLGSRPQAGKEAGVEIPPAAFHSECSFLRCLFLGPNAHSVSLAKEKLASLPEACNL